MRKWLMQRVLPVWQKAAAEAAGSRSSGQQQQQQQQWAVVVSGRVESAADLVRVQMQATHLGAGGHDIATNTAQCSC
jgi:hypothetical protein